MSSERDYYSILGVSRDASDTEIRRAFRTLAKKHHPDKQAGDTGLDFSLLSEAYEALKDPNRRADYDEELNLARQVSAKASKGGKSPFAFAAGLSLGVAIAVIAVMAFAHLELGFGKRAEKVQDSLKIGASARIPLQTRVAPPPSDEATSPSPPAKPAETADAQPPPAVVQEPAQKPAVDAAPPDSSEPRPAVSLKEHKLQSRVLGPGEPLEIAVGLLDNEKLLRLTPGKGQTESFTDCPSCPGMVLIPSGQGVMGARPESDGYRSEEAPPHRIHFDKPFAVSKDAISASNWRSCVNAGVCRLTLSSLLAVGPRVAATRISWFDARSYVEWLTQVTGWRYRLLSESEWEYIAKAGVRKEVDAGRNRSVSDSAKEMTEVLPRVRFDQFSGAGHNAWGVQSGSVLEWVEDCWHPNYEQAPSDGASWLSAAGGDCAYRVVRGTAKSGGAFGSRPSARAREFADTSSPTLGFRVAREIFGPEEN